MGRICQVIGYVTIALSLVPLAVMLGIEASGNRDGGGTWMGALLFSLPWLGGVVAGVLTITFGSMLIELQRIGDYASTAAAKLDELVRQGRH